MKTITGVLLSLLCLLLPISILSGQTVLHVSKQGPFTRIQDDIDFAKDGYVILVGPGHYVENVDYKRKYIMVVSRSGPEATLIDGNDKGTAVKIERGVLAGFTVTRGSQSGVYISGTGTIINNIIVNNKGYVGGGVSSSEVSVITGNVITGNTATVDGGGIGTGGSTSNPTILENVITGNTAGERGGGIGCRGWDVKVFYNEISNNTAGTLGGGIYFRKSNLFLGSNLIYENTSLGNGGGIGTYFGDVRCCNNTILGNSAVKEGGGIYLPGSSSTVTNTILWDNKAAGKGPEIRIVDGTLSIDHSILKGGKASVSTDPRAVLTWGAVILTADPLFVDRKGRDFHLLATSPCLDRGDRNAPGLPALDFEGDPRIASASADIGADEFHPHVYGPDRAAPGGKVRIHMIGPPGAPVLVGLSLTSQPRNPPLYIPGYGYLLLSDPFWILVPGTIPSTGLFTLPMEVPAGFPVPTDAAFQALIGYRFSNVHCVKIRKPGS